AEVRISGLSHELTAGLKPGLALSVKHGLLRTGPPLNVDVLQGDLDRCRLFLGQHGYPDASIDVKFQARSRHRVEVDLEFTPGMPVKIASAEAIGLPESSGPGSSRIKEGEIFEDARVAGEAQRLAD